MIPAMLRVQFKVDDVVSSLLLNSIIFYALMALIEGPWKDPFSGYPISPPIEDSAIFPVLMAGTRLHIGVVAALDRGAAGLVPDCPHDARLRDPRHRREPGGRALRRHQRAARPRSPRRCCRAGWPALPASARSAACTTR